MGVLAAGGGYHLLRLTSASDFERVRRDGRSHAHPLVVLIARRRDQGELPPSGPAQVVEVRPRVGVVAGRSVGKAVSRNRAKRLLREAVRGFVPELAPNWDVLLVARAPLAAARMPEARAAVGQLLTRAGLLKKLESDDG